MGALEDEVAEIERTLLNEAHRQWILTRDPRDEARFTEILMRQSKGWTRTPQREE